MRLVRLLYPLLLTALVVLTGAAPAEAIPGISDCKEAPAPEAPGSGIAGFFTKAPDPLPKDDPDAKEPNFANYGMAGLTFTTYDLGCGPDAMRDPGAVVGTTIANWIYEVDKFFVSAANALLGSAYSPDFLGVFDDMLVNVTDALQTAIFDQWVPLVLVIVGVLIMWRAKSMAWSHVATTVGWALLVLILATAVFQWPVKAGHVADESITTALGAANSGINSTAPGDDEEPVTAATNSITNAVLYQQWLMGTFGRSNSATAKKYGYALFQTQALTWREAALVREDPDGAGKALLEDKANQYEDIADAVKSQDPDAYEYLTGHRGQGRIAAALVAFVAAMAVLPFVIAAALLMLCAYLIIRLAVMFLPVLATVGIAHQFRGAVVGLASTVAAAIVNTVMFGVALSVLLLLTRTLLDPASGLPLWLALGLLFLLSLIMWFATKPLRSLTKMASPSNMFRDAAGAAATAGSKVKDGVTDLGKAAVVGATGGAAAGAVVAHEVAEEAAKRTETTTTTVPTAEPLRAQPAPAPVPEPIAEPVALAAAPVTAPVGALPAAAAVTGPAAVAPPIVVDEYPGKHRAEDDRLAVAALPVGSIPAPTPEAATPGQEVADPGTTPPATEPPTPGYRPTTPGDPTVFVPGQPDYHSPGLPPVAEPQIDDDGDEVYTLFVPTEDAYVSGQDAEQ